MMMIAIVFASQEHFDSIHDKHPKLDNSSRFVSEYSWWYDAATMAVILLIRKHVNQSRDTKYIQGTGLDRVLVWYLGLELGARVG